MQPSLFDLNVYESWGPESHGIKVSVNPTIEELSQALGKSPLISLDVETNEGDMFVGCGLYDGGGTVYYCTDPKVLEFLKDKKIVGFNVKQDLHWLEKHGISLDIANVQADVMIMAYVLDSTREHLGLKDVANASLHLSWPSYKDIVGRGRSKITLEKQDTLRVAHYCGMDALATYKLYNFFSGKLTCQQTRLLDSLEMPVYRMLYQMEKTGVLLDVQRLAQLDTEFSAEMQMAEDTLATFDKDFNPRSPKQVMEVLKQNGIRVEATNKVSLMAHQGVPLVDTLLRHRRVSKLLSTYVCAFKKLPTLPRVHTTLNQVSLDANTGGFKGIRTGRLSSSEPNLQNIPASGDGEKIRELFIPRQGATLLCFDYNQIEYRLLAHFTGDNRLIEAFKKGEDVHKTTADLIGCDRKTGKTINFAAIYGAGAKKIGFTAGIPESEAQKFLDVYWLKLPAVRAWINKVKFEARMRKGVNTMGGRWIPLPEITCKNRFERFHWERAAVNYIIQGSAADIIKTAMLQIQRSGRMPTLQVHDELLFECAPEMCTAELVAIKTIMEGVVKLRVPVMADAHSGVNWRTAKNAKNP